MAKTSKNTESTPKDKRLNNLKDPWKKGESGNPNGRPKGSLNFKKIVKELLAIESEELNELTNKKEKLNQYYLLIIKAIKEAKEGSVQHLKTLLEYLEEKPKQTIENHNTELKINVESEEDRKALEDM